MPIDCIMCVPVQHLLLISQLERHSHHNKHKTAISVHQEEQGPPHVALHTIYINLTTAWHMCSFFCVV